MSDSLLKALLSFEICVQKMPAEANSLLFFSLFLYSCNRANAFCVVVGYCCVVVVFVYVVVVCSN